MSSLVFQNVNIIDMTDAPPMPDMSIVISDGRIVDLGKTDDVTFPKDVRMIQTDSAIFLPVANVEMDGSRTGRRSVTAAPP